MSGHIVLRAGVHVRGEAHLSMRSPWAKVRCSTTPVPLARGSAPAKFSCDEKGHRRHLPDATQGGEEEEEENDKAWWGVGW